MGERPGRVAARAGRAAAQTMHEDFPVGSRVRYKRAAYAGMAGHRGTVTGHTALKVRVRWDHEPWWNNPAYAHVIERVDLAPESSSLPRAAEPAPDPVECGPDREHEQ